MVEERLRYAIRFLSRHLKDFSLKEWRQINNPNYTKLLTLPKIKTDQFATFYSIRFSYCTSHLHIIGKDKNGKWIRYIDSKKISDKYFNGKDAYKEDGGVIYDQPICRDDSIVVVYRRWHWKGMSEAEGEFRFKWDDKAQWFSVEQVIY